MIYCQSARNHQQPEWHLMWSIGFSRCVLSVIPIWFYKVYFENCYTIYSKMQADSIAIIKQPFHMHILHYLCYFHHMKFCISKSWHLLIYYNTMTWTSWHLKSMATWLFIQKSIQTDNRKCQMYTWIALCDGIHSWPMDSPHKVL